MRKIFLLSLIPLLTGCSTDNKPSVTGSYYRCLRDGEYQETRISQNRIMFIGSNFPDNINIMSNRIQGNTMEVAGLNFDLMFGTDSLTVIGITDSSLTLNNHFGDFELKRLSLEIPEIDSLNLESTVNELLTGFNERTLSAGCPDLRTEEEKNPEIWMGVVEDIIDIDELPACALAKWNKYESTFERSYQLLPSFLEEDFNGDGTNDIAVFVSKKSDEKQGVLFLFGKDDKMFISGAGNSFGPGGDDFKWADYWELFTESKTYETTFLDNGDIDGSREVSLKYPAISIREEEGSGGLIYFNGEKFTWIHQGD